jgi:hypothetical protein
MDQHEVPNSSADVRRDETPPTNERPPKRFRIVKLEERIAPTTQSGSGVNCGATVMMEKCTVTCVGYFTGG